MHNSTFKKALDKYIVQQTIEIERLKTLTVADFKTLTISCDKIASGAKGWCSYLEQSGISKTTPVLYYFEVKSDSTKIYDVVSKLKGKYKINSKYYKALPKVNIPDPDNASTVLYVGKTNSNFISRFRYHLGMGSSKTYALQLLHWACELNLILDLHYSIVNLPKEEIKYLEQLESALHLSLKPILGRSGH